MNATIIFWSCIAILLAPPAIVTVNSLRRWLGARSERERIAAAAEQQRRLDARAATEASLARKLSQLPTRRGGRP